ncbi:chaplin [Streptomyces sp. NPDC059740]|uniref:chaplin n=1 Tax=Streptomyces sp. NPDC059740 TaxID=3346926 RepID=UPI00365CA78C
MTRVKKSLGLAVAVSAAMVAGVTGATADSGAKGVAVGSPGVLSGNVIQVPIDVPINVCGNTINVIGLLNPAAGNRCGERSDHRRDDHRRDERRWHGHRDHRDHHGFDCHCKRKHHKHDEHSGK